MKDCPIVLRMKKQFRKKRIPFNVEIRSNLKEINRLYNQIQDNIRLMAAPIFKVKK